MPISDVVTLTDANIQNFYKYPKKGAFIFLSLHLQ